MGSKPSKKTRRDETPVESEGSFKPIGEATPPVTPKTGTNDTQDQLDSNKNALEVTPSSSRRASTPTGGSHANGGRKVSCAVPTNTDVMISYSHIDTELMKTLKENLTTKGLTVWVDVVGLSAGVDFLSKIGEAIIDSKAFITLLSENSIKSKYCQDELALAYISNKPIFPVSIQPPNDLVPLMDTGMRLQLATMPWTIIDDMDKFNDKFVELFTKLMDMMDKSEGRTKESERPDTAGSSRKTANRYRFYTREVSESNAQEQDPRYTESPNEFWERNFKNKLEIQWHQFISALVEEYASDLDSMYSNEDQEWLKSILRREMEIEDNEGMLDRSLFLGFCTVEDELLPLWRRIEEQARESYAMREVFDMKSSVRIQAIENLAKIKGPAVMDALRDLLEDPEPNVRAVAAISLAKTGSNDRLTIKKVLKTLNDKDRLVRESGCIALGRMKAHSAVPRLVHIWRNDVISTVRAAAELALNQIGGPDVEKAMHITHILTEEIRMLTNSVDK